MVKYKNENWDEFWALMVKKWVNIRMKIGLKL